MASFYEELLKNDSISDDSENAQSRMNVDKWIFRLFLLIIGFTPLIVLANMKDVISPLISNIDILTSGTKGDLFTQYKALFILIMTVIVSALFLAKVFFMNGTIRKTPINYALGLFVVAIILSTVLSPNISIAMHGIYNRTDGAISWLCYIALFFVAMNIEYPKKVVSKIMYTMMPFVFINLYIITMNFNGKDLLQYVWLQKLVSILLPEGASLSNGSILIGTLNQWNYMSGMFAIMTVMYLAWAITSEKWIETIIGAVTASAAIAVMFMSISTSGFIAVIISIILLVVIFIKSPVKKNAIAALIIFLVIASPTFHMLASKNDNVWKESFGFLISSNPYENDDKAKVGTKSTIFSEKAYAADQQLKLPTLPEKGWSPGSGRMYIWEKMFDLFEEKPLLGYGLDSVVYNFPHFNIDARAGNNSENTIVDKPHNLYIEILYGTGFIGAIAFLLAILSVAFVSAKSLVVRNKLHISILFVGCFAFFVQAMFNDSHPGVTQVIFIFMGMLICLLNSEKTKSE